MKKLLALTLSLAAVMCTVCGCGDEKSDGIAGKWYSDQLAGSFIFSEDDKTMFYSVDYSDFMYFDAENNLIINDASFPAEYDGTTLSVDTYEDTGDNFFSLERMDSADPDSINGHYRVTSGTLYDDMIAVYTTATDENTMQMFIDGEKIEFAMKICNYSAGSTEVVLSNVERSLFEFSSEENVSCTYKINGDTLVLTVKETGQSVEFTRAD